MKPHTSSIQGSEELILCNCDGFWHVSVPPNPERATMYVDVTALSDLLATNPKSIEGLIEGKSIYSEEVYKGI